MELDKALGEEMVVVNDSGVVVRQPHGVVQSKWVCRALPGGVETRLRLMAHGRFGEGGLGRGGGTVDKTRSCLAMGDEMLSCCAKGDVSIWLLLERKKMGKKIL